MQNLSLSIITYSKAFVKHLRYIFTLSLKNFRFCIEIKKLFNPYTIGKNRKFSNPHNQLPIYGKYTSSVGDVQLLLVDVENIYF